MSLETWFQTRLLQLGSYTKLKVSTFPRDLLDPLQSRCGSLPGEWATPRRWLLGVRNCAACRDSRGLCRNTVHAWRQDLRSHR